MFFVVKFLTKKMYQYQTQIRFPKNNFMKSTILATLFLIATVSTTHAQFLKLGAMGGANAVKVSGKSFNDQFDYGYWAGGFAEIKLSKNWFLKPEVQFSESRLRNTTNFKSIYQSLVNTDTLGHIKLQYLSIPITLNYKIANILALNFGAQYGIQLDNHQTLLKNGQDAFKSGDFSVLGGATIMLGRFRVSGEYVIGLNNLNDIDNQDHWKNQTIRAGIGFVL
jgi:hypothetical protein